jgi:predicted O-methyltransferase YrrM
LKTTPMTEALYEFVLQNAPVPHPILSEVVELTAQRNDRNMQIAQDQGAFMKLICQLMNARRVVEVGCFTGYSAICLASGLAPSGKLYSIDKNTKTGAIAQDFFVRAGLADRIELRQGLALNELDRLLEEFGEASFDIGFIDADKSRIPDYYEKILRLLRSNGLVMIDNTIWSGRVVDPSDQDDDTNAIRNFCLKLRNDSRVDQLLLHISDGIYLARKR